MLYTVLYSIMHLFKNIKNTTLKNYLAFLVLLTYGALGAWLLHDSQTIQTNAPWLNSYVLFALQSSWLLGLFNLFQQFNQTKQNNQTHLFAFISPFSAGLLIGIGYFTYGLHWLFIAMHTYGHLPFILAGFALLLFASANALFYAFAFKLAKQPWQLIASLTLAELARNYVLTGFPAMSPVYHLANHANAMPIYALLLKTVGMYGTLFAYLTVLYLFWLCLNSIKKSFNHTVLCLNGLIFLLGLHTVFGGFFPVLNHTQSQKFIHIALLQGNVSQDVKFAQDMQFHSLQVYLDLIEQVKRYEKQHQQIIDLIVTPETALPFFKEDIPQAFFTQADQLLGNTPLVFGAVDVALKAQQHQSKQHQSKQHKQNNEFGFLNSLFLLQKSQLKNIYQKQHLVPIGEFMPYGLAWFVKLMNIPLVELIPGSAVQAPLLLNKHGQTIAIGFNICYELFFSDEMAHADQIVNAQAIINSTNLAWFGKKTALHQFLDIGKTRSLELNKPILMVNNEGITANINAGVVKKQLAIAQPGFLIVQLPVDELKQPSFYSKHVQIILWMLALLCVILLLPIRKIRKINKVNHQQKMH